MATMDIVGNKWPTGVRGVHREVAVFETDAVGMADVHAPRRKGQFLVDQVVWEPRMEHRAFGVGPLHLRNVSRSIRRRAAASMRL